MSSSPRTFEEWKEHCRTTSLPIHTFLHNPPAEMKRFLTLCTENDAQYWFLLHGSAGTAANYVRAMRTHLTRLRQKVRDLHSLIPQQFKIYQITLVQGKDMNGNPQTLVGLVRTSRPSPEIRKAINDPIQDFIDSIAVTEETV